MNILLVVGALSLVVTAKGGNYDAYLADMELRSRQLLDEFRRNYPNGAEILDVLTSPEFREAHPILSENDHNMDFDKRDFEDNWERVIASLLYADEAARHPDPGAAKRFQSWLSEQQMNVTPTKARADLAYLESELNPQNNNWGTRSVPVGSSEVGSWIDYAVSGAQAQEDDEDEDENENEEQQGEVITGDPNLEIRWKSAAMNKQCDAPNPCPIGYVSDTLSTPCDPNIEDTEEFNRNWILRKIESGECSCDKAHMKCPKSRKRVSWTIAQ